MITEEEVKKQTNLAMQALRDSHEFVVMKLIYSIPPEPLECPDGTKIETFGGLQFAKPKCWEILDLDDKVFNQLMKSIAKEAMEIAIKS